MALDVATRSFRWGQRTLQLSGQCLFFKSGHYPGLDCFHFRAQSICMLLTAVLIPAEEGGFVALNPETGTTTQGETVSEAVSNLQEATQLYLEEFPLENSGSPIVTTFEVVAHA
jgi:predicted RNase H-like HicB family nuclease